MLLRTILSMGLVVVGATACVTSRDFSSVNQGGSGNSAGSAGDAGVDTPTATQCQSYCEDAVANCREDVEVRGEIVDLEIYDSERSCLNLCVYLDVGSSADDANTLSCRANQAIVALNNPEPDVHCPQAGPGGNGRCGSDCEAYCQLRPRICGDVESAALILETEECLRQCEGLVDSDTFNANDLYVGDTLECRLNHLVAASEPGAETTHCPHTRMVPLYDDGAPNPCTDTVERYPNDFRTRTCDGYCKLVMTACTDDLAVYETTADCLAVCNDTDIFETGTEEDRDGQTAACRRYHAYVALSEPGTHCPHAGPTGDGVCTDENADSNCPAHCALLRQACPASFEAEYAMNGEDPADAQDNCEADCGTLPDNATASGYSFADAIGETADTGALQCRTWYAVKARRERGASDTEDAETCAAAFGDAAPCQ